MKQSEYQLMYKRETTFWWYTVKREFIKVFLDTIPHNSHRTILDIGSGTGGNMGLLSTYGKVRGIDISKTAVNLCRKRGITNITTGNANRLYFPENTFDMVTMFDVLYHSWINEQQALQEIYRVIKPGGYLVMTDCAYPVLFSRHDIRNMARTRYTKATLNRALSRAGFGIIRTSYTFCLTFPVFAVTRLLSKSERMESSLANEPSLPGFINTAFEILGKNEATLLKYVDLPFGSSLIVLAQKT